MKKTNLIIVLIIIIIVAGTYVLFFNKQLPQTDNLQTIQPETLQITEEKIVNNTAPFKIDIAYPKIAGIDYFNRKVKTAIDKEINDFKTNSLANDQAVKEVDPESYAKYPREYSLNIGYDKGQTDNKILSAMLNVYTFEGGAHGASYFIPINYNLETKKDIVLSDVFAGQTDYLKKISDFCIKDLTKQMIASGAIEMSDTSWIERGAGPTEENFQFFLINQDNTITFYFPQYQVAAGAAGDFKVTMPR